MTCRDAGLAAGAFIKIDLKGILLVLSRLGEESGSCKTETQPAQTIASCFPENTPTGVCSVSCSFKSISTGDSSTVGLRHGYATDNALSIRQQNADD